VAESVTLLQIWAQDTLVPVFRGLAYLTVTATIRPSLIAKTEDG